MTSSDVLDTSLALLLREAADLCLLASESLLDALRARVEEHRHTVMIGRSHGIHAEPITFGLSLAGHYAEFVRCHHRLVAARDEVAVGTISGAVGTFAHLSPAIEADALVCAGPAAARRCQRRWCRAIGTRSSSPRSPSVAGAIERLAVQVRHWQRTEVHEAEEAFTARAEGVERDAPQAQPHRLGEPLRPRPGDARLRRCRAENTPSGTSATSPTPPPSA
jgi:adenylosuccinate lyase